MEDRLDPGIVEQYGRDLQEIREEMAKIVVGQTGVIDNLLVGLLANGHILVEAIPGLAKTLAVKTLVKTLELPGDSVLPLGNAVVAELGLDSNARKQNLYYFPNGLTRAMTLRATFAASGDASERQILQHGRANYDYQDNTVNINNHRMWDASLRVPTLPTDEPETVEFLQKVAPGTISFGNVSVRDRDRYEGLLVGVPRDGVGESDQPWAVPHQNALQEDYFKADWPTTTVRVDNRDAMHKRGWTYFRISGQVNGQKVSGSGRIPFFYEAFKDGGAWLKLQVGSLTIVDSYRDAHVSRAQSDPHGTYRPGSFFKGLGRPWMGLHTIDTVRRDAAEERIWFNAEYLPGGQFARRWADVPQPPLRLAPGPGRPRGAQSGTVAATAIPPRREVTRRRAA